MAADSESCFEVRCIFCIYSSVAYFSNRPGPLLENAFIPQVRRCVAHLQGHGYPSRLSAHRLPNRDSFRVQNYRRMPVGKKMYKAFGIPRNSVTDTFWMPGREP